MTSKEALKIIETYNYWNGVEEITGNTCVNPVYLEVKKHYEEAKDILENDLEVLEIIKNKQVDIFWLNKCDTYTAYNSWMGLQRMLTEDEFNKLKEWLENE